MICDRVLVVQICWWLDNDVELDLTLVCDFLEQNNNNNDDDNNNNNNDDDDDNNNNNSNTKKTPGFLPFKTKEFTYEC